MRTISLRTLIALLIFCALPPLLPAQTDETARCNQAFSYAFEHALIKKPIGDVVVALAGRFTNAPYEEHTLDRGGREELVENLHSFDCVTLVESVLALALAVKSNRMTHEYYREMLQLLRYRGGVCAGFGSRLNYFSEWISDNERKGLVRDLTQTLGGVPLQKAIHYISDARRFSDDSTAASIRSAEQRLSDTTYFEIPLAKVPRIVASLRDGDIIAVTTTVRGLDVAHTGFVVRSADGTVHLLHASETGRKVETTKEPLGQYLSRHKTFSGIRVVRVVERGDRG